MTGSNPAELVGWVRCKEKEYLAAKSTVELAYAVKTAKVEEIASKKSKDKEDR